MAAKHNFTVHKIKDMICGHRQLFSTPVPQRGEIVWCLTCDKESKILPRGNVQSWTVANGRPRRLKENPRGNNQYTKGRALS